MHDTPSSDRFKKMMTEAVTLPLGLTVLLSSIFIGIILHLGSVSRMVDHSNQVIARSNELIKLVIDSETGLRGFVITNSNNFLEPYNWSETRVPGGFTELKALLADNPAQTQSAQRAQALYGEWKDYAGRVIELRRTRGEYLKLINSEQGKRLMDAIRVQFTQLTQNEEHLRDERSRSAQESVQLALICIVAASLIMGGMLALASRRKLVSLSSTYETTLARQLEQNAALQEQDWLRARQVDIARNLRGELALEALSQSALSRLADGLGAQVGAIYVLEGEVLRRTATFAYSSEAAARPQVLRRGETLVGQAVIENRLMRVQDLPEGYLQVSSGTGALKARHLIVAPLTADGEVKGVVELGFLHAPEPRAEELIERVAEIIGVALKSTQYRTRLQELLEESQQQSEELQAQQEELRVSNEELEEQSKALKESATRLESQQAELEQTNLQLEQQARSLERQADLLAERNNDLELTRTDLERKARELEAASQYKSQFLANMSHELRTPLNSTLILSQLLIENKSGNLSLDQIDYAKTILASCNDLLRLINDILDLSKVEAGKIDLHGESVHPSELAASLDKTFAPMAREKNIDFRIEIIDPKPFETDRQRLEQILKNLISNAIKFTEHGEVRLTLTREPAGGGGLNFAVRDTGIGIAPEQQQSIFDAFHQADGTTSRRYGGTGLGLTISRDLARLLGGEIRVQSQVGQGSVFSVLLPERMPSLPGAKAPSALSTPPIDSIVTPSAPAPGAADELAALALPAFPDDRDLPDDASRLLLIVEDDSAFARVLFDLSKERNFRCLVAHTAQAGLQLARDRQPHAIVLDLHLPDQSGLTVLDRLKQDPRTRHIPIHIVSAQDRSQLALQMGAVGYLKKPTGRDELQSVLRGLEERLDQKMKRVLIVEDDRVQRESIRKLIEDENVRPEAAATGQEALRALAERHYDCMIVDLKLPDMTGFDLLERMSQSTAPQPPVIVYTGKSLSPEEEARLGRYSRSIILKGAKSPERLLSEVTLFLHSVESQLPEERQKLLRELRNRDQAFESRRLLLVDDDVRNIFALSSALEPLGAEIVIARNGKEALAKMRAGPGIDLVLMDIMMPEMDGYEATREMRRDPRLAKIPVIAVTARAMPDDQEKCLAAGANDYLSKPVDIAKLISLIRVWMPQGARS